MKTETNPKKKSGRKYSNKSKNSKNKKFKPEDREEIMKERPGKNDINWYGDSRLIEAAGRINFTNPLGKPIGWMFDNTGVTQFSLDTGSYAVESVPGIMSISVEPGIGIAEYGSDISNVFVRNFYSYLRHVNSGHTNYNAPDLGIYIMAVDQIHLVLEHLIRIYGIARTFSSANRYMPTVLLNALGIDPYSASGTLYDRLADFRAYLLMLMVKAGTLCLPSTFSFVERHSSLFRYVYADGSTSKSQLYVFKPDGYKTYNAAALPTGGYLANTPVYGLHSAWDWLNYAESMIQAVVEDEDMNIMSGDILKAYGTEGVFKMSYFDENYTVVPMYNPEILLEIHNIKFAGNEYSAGDFNIYQDPSLNIIKYTPVFGNPIPVGGISPIIDMPVEVPSPEQVMIATRFAHMGSMEAITGGYKYVPSYIGSEVATRCEIWQFNTISGSWSAANMAMYGGETVSANVLNYEAAAMISKFDWAPPFYVVNVGTSPDAVTLETVFGDLENYTPLNQGDLRKLHEVALIGEFKVPLMGLMELK